MFKMVQNHSSEEWQDSWRYNFEVVNLKIYRRYYWCREELRHKIALTTRASRIAEKIIDFGRINPIEIEDIDE